MPIGKNAIKRVTTQAKETEVKVEEIKVEEVKAEEVKAEAVKVEVKKPTAQKKSLEKEPDLSPVKTAKKVTKKAKTASKRECDYIAVGEELPIYLL